MRRFNVLLFVLAFVAKAQAQWTITSTQSDFSAERRVEHRHLSVRSEGGDEATMELAIFSPKTATLRVIDDPNANDSLGNVMQREHCLAGTNGGYFDPNYAPVGLMISDGRVIAPLQTARLLSAVLSVTNGRVRIQRAAQFSIKAKPNAARQCGPFLVENGKAITGLNDSARARRTFALTSGSDRAAIGFCSHVTLAQLGSLLTSPGVLETGSVQQAMNFDGGSSSGFWFAGENGVFSIREQKTVRDYLAVVPR